MDTLLAHLAAWRPFRALVVGDFMLDQLLYGTADRLSADAPVPVLRVDRQEDRPGGAANLCLDLVALHGRVAAVGVVGADQEATHLRTALLQQGVDANALVTDGTRPTTVKRNLIGLAQGRHAQKMFRVDFESRAPIADAVVERLLRAFEAEVTRADVVCIEDYNKGVCTPEVCRGVIESARRAGKPVFVDPAQLTDYSKYRGATAITPNRTEAERATGMTSSEAGAEHNAAIARRLLDELGVEAVVVTLDRHGALLATRDADPLPVPTVAREVYDVTGAGDMMLAGLAAARANGADWASSVRFANAAAGLEVEVFGVMPIPLERVHAELLEQDSARRTGVRSPEEAVVRVRAARRAGKRVVFTNGCFDVIHAGHVWLLDRAKAEGDFLVVGVNADETIRAYKGPNRPVNHVEDRVRVLRAMASVDEVVVYAEDTPVELIKKIEPEVLVKGDEYAIDQIPGAAWVQRRGGRVVRVPMLDDRSTTAVLERLGDARAEVTTGQARERFVADTSADAR